MLDNVRVEFKEKTSNSMVISKVGVLHLSQSCLKWES
jgi:hypothetical protein